MLALVVQANVIIVKNDLFIIMLISEYSRLHFMCLLRQSSYFTHFYTDNSQSHHCTLVIFINCKLRLSYHTIRNMTCESGKFDGMWKNPYGAIKILQSWLFEASSRISLVKGERNIRMMNPHQ